MHINTSLLLDRFATVFDILDMCMLDKKTGPNSVYQGI
jgi:hypothetical protein